jgi:hypothetical protein
MFCQVHADVGLMALSAACYSPLCTKIYITMGSVQLSIASLGPLILQKQKYLDNFMEIIMLVTRLLGK